MKKQEGITLIALVITIIVLLILAGVTIAMLTGDNGLLTRASSSKTESLKAEVAEIVNMELNAQMANVMSGDAFEAVATINARLTNAMPDGYTATAALDSGTAGTYAATDVLSITVTTTTGNALSTAKGEVKQVSNKWTIVPVVK